MLIGPTAWIWWSRPARELGDESILGDGERRRLAALVHERDKASFVSVRRLARQAVAAALVTTEAAVSLSQVCERCGGPHGQPAVIAPTQPPLAISWTRTRALVAVAVATVPVGVDVEPADRGALDPALVLSAVERAQLEQLPRRARSRAVLAWWVRKEALLKSIGAGLDAFSPTALDVPPPGRPGRTTSPIDQTVRWVDDVTVADDVVVAIAAAGDQSPTVQVVECTLTGTIS